MYKSLKAFKVSSTNSGDVEVFLATRSQAVTIWFENLNEVADVAKKLSNAADKAQAWRMSHTDTDEY